MTRQGMLLHTPLLQTTKYIKQACHVKERLALHSTTNYYFAVLHNYPIALFEIMKQGKREASTGNQSQTAQNSLQGLWTKHFIIFILYLENSKPNSAWQFGLSTGQKNVGQRRSETGGFYLDCDPLQSQQRIVTWATERFFRVKTEREGDTFRISMHMLPVFSNAT